MSGSSLPDHLIFNGNGGSYPPHGLITASDHGPAVVVATWIMVCLMGLAVIARFGTRQDLSVDGAAISVASVYFTLFLLLFTLARGYKSRILTIWAVQVLAIIQSVVIHLAANHGLGRHTRNLNTHDYAYYSKVRLWNLVFDSNLPLVLALKYVLGNLYEPNPEAPDLLSSKTISHTRFPTTNASTTDAANSMVLLPYDNPVGGGSHYYPQYPVPATNTVETVWS